MPWRRGAMDSTTSSARILEYPIRAVRATVFAVPIPNTIEWHTSVVSYGEARVRPIGCTPAMISMQLPTCLFPVNGGLLV